MTDHTMLAEADLDTAARAIRRSDLTEVEVITATLALAQVHATLALVEQQRIANLIALTKETFAAHEAREALGTFATAKLGEQIGLRPDIAAALSIEALDHDRPGIPMPHETVGETASREDHRND